MSSAQKGIMLKCAHCSNRVPLISQPGPPGFQLALAVPSDSGLLVDGHPSGVKLSVVCPTCRQVKAMTAKGQVPHG